MEEGLSLSTQVVASVRSHDINVALFDVACQVARQSHRVSAAGPHLSAPAPELGILAEEAHPRALWAGPDSMYWTG